MLNWSVLRFLVFAAGLFYIAFQASAQPTFSREVSRILQDKCQNCHRPDDIAPFSLLTYDDARIRARSIRTAVESRQMPPWKPVAGHGTFRGDISLSDEQRNTILHWIDDGMPEGDPADLPPPKEFAGEWRRGKPDQIISMPEPYLPVARDDRPDRYRCFIVPNIAEQDRWVKAVDIVPGVRHSVHHVLLYLTDDAAQISRAEAFGREDPEPGYDCWGGPRITPGAGPGILKIAGGLLGGWVPGAAPNELPDDVGILVPKGVTLILQIHYNLHDHDQDEAPEADQTRVGLYFHEKPPRTRLLTLPVVNNTFVLEPGVMGKRVDAAFDIDLTPLGFAVPEFLLPKFSMVQVAPHMHQLGREIRADLEQPDGTQVPLIRIDNWDFHWQGFYSYQKAVPMPYKSKIRLGCTFDNTTDREVRWGEGTEDEMCLLYVGFVAEGGLAFLLGNPQ